MITKIDNAILLCSNSKAWEIKKDDKSGIAYSAMIYSNKTVINCKTDKEMYEKLGTQELVKGTAVIDITTTNYNDKEKVVYVLKEFGITK